MMSVTGRRCAAPTAWRSAVEAGAQVAPGLRLELYGPAGYAPGEQGCRLQAGAVEAAQPLRAPFAEAAGPLPAGLILPERA